MITYLTSDKQLSVIAFYMRKAACSGGFMHFELL